MSAFEHAKKFAGRKRIKEQEPDSYSSLTYKSTLINAVFEMSSVKSYLYT